MRIGIALHTGFGLESVRFLATQLVAMLRSGHDLRFLPAEYEFADALDRERIAQSLVAECDLLIGFHSAIAPLLVARQRAGVTTPCIVLLLGSLPRGALTLRSLLPLLHSRDVFVATSSADARLFRLFIANSRVEVIPFEYNAREYYVSSEEERQTTRELLGCAPNSPLVMYVGRHTLEKNVHSVFRVFNGVALAHPNARFVSAGAAADVAFSEIGSWPLDESRTLRELGAALDLIPDRLRHLGVVDPSRLRALYGAADVVVNLTLHHDENFGFSQVEAAACGTPVVGSAWGGLQDTVRANVTGYQVATHATPLGVKVNWWEALNKVHLILSQPGSFTRSKLHGACAEYVPARHAAKWRALMEDVHQVAATEACSPLCATDFARLFWALCAPADSQHPTYVHGTHSFDLYRELIAPYTSVTPESIPTSEPWNDDQTFVLPAPVVSHDDGRLQVNDPIFPFDVEVPRRLKGSAHDLLTLLHEEPAISVPRLLSHFARHDSTVDDCLRWMLFEGLLLRSHASAGWLDSKTIGRRLGQYMRASTFDIRTVDRRRTDILQLREWVSSARG